MLPPWLLTLAAWCLAVAGLGVLLCLAGVALWWGAIWCVRGFQAVLRLVGVYEDFWWWYRRERIGVAPQRRKED